MSGVYRVRTNRPTGAPESFDVCGPSEEHGPGWGPTIASTPDRERASVMARALNTAHDAIGPVPDALLRDLAAPADQIAMALHGIGRQLARVADHLAELRHERADE